MRIDQVKRIEKLEVKDPELCRLLSDEEEKFIDVFLDLLTYFPRKKNEEKELLSFLLQEYHALYQVEMLMTLRDIIETTFPRNGAYEVREVIENFIHPVLHSMFNIEKYKEEVLKLCRIPGFIRNIMEKKEKGKEYWITIYNIIDSDDQPMKNIAFDSNLILEGIHYHLFTLNSYRQLVDVIPEKQADKREEIKQFIERIVRNSTMMKTHQKDIHYYDALIEEYEEAFMENDCFEKIISNKEVLLHRDKNQLVTLVKWYIQYKEVNRHHVLFILTNPIMLQFPFGYQEILRKRMEELDNSALDEYMAYIAFILIEFSIVEQDNLWNIMKYFLINYKSEPTIGTLLLYGWPITSLLQYMEKHHIHEFTSNTSIKKYILEEYERKQ